MSDKPKYPKYPPGFGGPYLFQQDPKNPPVVNPQELKAQRDAALARAEKAEVDLKRVTAERDAAWSGAEEAEFDYARAFARAEKAEADLKLTDAALHDSLAKLDAAEAQVEKLRADTIDECAARCRQFADKEAEKFEHPGNAARYLSEQILRLKCKDEDREELLGWMASERRAFNGAPWPQEEPKR